MGFSWEDGTLLKKNAQILNHRGPDEEGYYVERVSLGHKRLSIIDLSTGQQPMFNEDGTIVVVFNGEIYNFQQLFKELQGKHTFRTKSDTESIIHAYEEWGVNCVQKFNGMFAFALFDKRKNLLFLARDPMGIKPLYYMVNEQGLSFASEMKALPFLSRTIDPIAIEHYLTFYCVPAPLTIYQEAKKLLPGHYLVYSIATKSLQVENYWDVQFRPPATINVNELKAEIISRLKASVKEQLIADVPLGVFLSGGIDSTSIVAFASQFTDRLTTFSICFAEDPEESEKEYIDLASKHFNTENHHLDFTFKDVVSNYDKLVWMYDEPYGDSSMFPTFLVSQLAAKSVKVSLSGDGGDELFAGYPRYLTYRKFRRLRSVPLSNLVGDTLMKFKNPRMYSIGRRLSSRTREDLYFQQNAQFNEKERAKLLRNPQNLDVYGKQRAYWNPRWPIESALLCDQRNYLHDDLLVKTDRASMATSLEVRVPYLQHYFVDFANSIPAELKLTTTTKFILKESLRGILPEKIIDRPKKGFNIPLRKWLLGNLTNMMEDLLLSGKFSNRGLLEENYIRNLIRDNKTIDHAERLWTLMCLEKWFEICHDPYL